LRRTGQSSRTLIEVHQATHYPELDWPVIAMVKEFPAQTRTGKHSHERGQLLFAVKGLMVANTAAGTWLVPRGHALWMPAHLKHDVSMHGDVSMRTAYVSADAAAHLSAECRVLKVGVLLEAALSALADELRGLRRTERTNHLIWLVLDEINRAPSTAFVLPLPQDVRLARLARALIAHPGSAKTIDQWCDTVGVSRRTMTRLFRSQTGVSFGDWRRRLRLLSAAARVADGEPLAKVAASLDYRNVAAFRTMARRHFGDDFPHLARDPHRRPPKKLWRHGS
jgi:AraC-like DNA-binding protein